MAAAELKLQVGLDLAFFRQQLAQLGSVAIGYQMPINVKFDRLNIQQELNKLEKNINRRKYKLEIATNIKSETDAAQKLDAALDALKDKAINVKFTGTGDLDLREARKIRTALSKSILSNGGKIKIPATILAAIAQDDVTAFTRAAQAKLKEIALNVRADITSSADGLDTKEVRKIRTALRSSILVEGGKIRIPATIETAITNDDIAKFKKSVKEKFSGIKVEIAAELKQGGASAAQQMNNLEGLFGRGKTGQAYSTNASAVGEARANVARQGLIARLEKQSLSKGGYNKPGLQQVITGLGGIPSGSSSEMRAQAIKLAKEVDNAVISKAWQTLESLQAQMKPLRGQRGIEAPRSASNINNILDPIANFTQNPGTARRMLRMLPESNISTNTLDVASRQARYYENTPSAREMQGKIKGFDPVMKAIAGDFANYTKGLSPSNPWVGNISRGIARMVSAAATSPQAQKLLPAAGQSSSSKMMRSAFAGLPPSQAPSIGQENAPLSRAATYSLNKARRILGMPIGPSSVYSPNPFAGAATVPPKAQAGGGFNLPPAGTTSNYSATARRAAWAQAYQQSRPMQAPSVSPPMGGGGAPPTPPTPPTPPGGGRGGFGSFGGIGGAMPSVSLPGAGLISELGGEFAMAAKQVLLFSTAYKALAFLTDFPSKVGDAVGQLQTFRNTLTAVTGGGQEFGKSNQFILDLVEKYNIPLQSARDGFAKLYASMAPAGFKGDEIREIFTGISQGAATFGMSADKVDRVNYAFAQMASKGQVMSEELKGQLGDVLPGAVAIFAEAAGFTGPDAMVKFTKAMEDGQYKGKAMKQLLLNVGVVMKKEFGPGAEGAARTFQGIMNRMQNATAKLYEAFAPMAIGFANQVVLPMTEGLKITADGFNAFFTGQKATTKGGAELASKLQELRPTFEGLANNIKSVIDRVVDLGKVFLPILELGAKLLASPLAGALAQIYVSTLLVNGAFSILATSGITKTAVALITSLIPATQQSTFFMYRLTLVTRGMWLAMTGPVGLAVLAIAAVTAALYAMHEPSREYLNTVPDRFADFWRDLASQANASGRKVQEAWRQVQKFFGGVINYIVKAFNEGMGKLPPQVKSAINQILPMLKKLEPGFNDITKNIITNWKKMIAEILMASNPVLRLAKILGVDVATSAVNAATKEQPTKIETEPYTVAGITYDRQTGRPIGQSLTPYTDANPVIPPIPGAGDDPTAAAKAKTLYENQKAYADKLSAAQTEADIKRQTTLFDNEKSMINMAYDLREARANSFEKETIRFQKELFNIEMTRQKAVMDANNEITKAQGKVAGDTGAIAPSSGFIDKSVLQTWLTSQGFGRTTGDFTNKGHATPNHMLNAMDMGIIGGSDADALRKTKAMEERLRRTGAFGDQLFGPTRDPMGHGAGKGGGNIHIHIPTPGGKVRMTPGLAAEMNYSGTTNAIGTGGKISASQSRAGLAAQSERNALQDRTTKFTLAEVEAIKQAEIATANYVASIMPVAEQELQNKLLQRRTELMRTGITPDLIDTEMKIYETQQKQTIGIQAAQKEIERVTKLKNEYKMSSDDAARVIANEQKVINLLTEDLDLYTKAIREAALANKNFAVQSALTDLGNRAQMARAFTPEAEMRVRIKQQYPKATESQLGDLFETEKTTVKAEELKTQMQGVASTIGDAFSTAFQGIINGSMSAQEALGNMFKSIGESFVKMAMDMIAKQVVMITLGFIMKALGLIGGIASAGNAAGAAAFSPGNAAGLDAIPGQAFSLPQLSGTMINGGEIGAKAFAGPLANGFAKGGAFSNGVRRFATGGIVNGPTLFPFADGGAMQMGLMGEAGPEAIMPLQRGADGSLGVRAAMGGNGMGGSSSSVLNMSFETSTINGVEYVSRDQLELAMAQTRRQASRDGANKGMAMTLDKIQQSPQTRRRIGM